MNAALALCVSLSLVTLDAAFINSSNTTDPFVDACGAYVDRRAQRYGFEARTRAEWVAVYVAGLYAYIGGNALAFMLPSFHLHAPCFF